MNKNNNKIDLIFNIKSKNVSKENKGFQILLCVLLFCLLIQGKMVMSWKERSLSDNKENQILQEMYENQLEERLKDYIENNNESNSKDEIDVLTLMEKYAQLQEYKMNKKLIEADNKNYSFSNVGKKFQSFVINLIKYKIIINKELEIDRAKNAPPTINKNYYI